ncbi:MAG: hypothetical protein IH614_04900 [Desulfuromonadales bacterium]|nr:hypothetical protein [Desulfuromonadales bacterium]
MKNRVRRCSKFTLGGLALLLIVMSSAEAGWKPHPDFGLCEVGDYAVFLLGKPAEEVEGTAKLDLSLVTVHGDVGVGPYSEFDFQGPAVINGNLYLDPTVTRILSNVGTVNGWRYTRDLFMPVAWTQEISEYWGGQPAGQKYATLTTSTAIRGESGINVIEIRNLDYAVEAGAQLTLEGPADALFVLNILGKLELGAGAGIRSSDPSRVLINVLPGLPPVRMAAGSYVGGSVLAVDRKMGPLMGTTGPLIGAQLKEISLLGGAVVNPPDPSLMPVAVLLADRAATVGDTVQLNGDASTSPDPQRELTYQWSLLAQPSGSAEVIHNPNAENAYFTPDLPGDYLVELLVDDGLMTSDPALILITAAEEGEMADLQLKIEAPKSVYLNDPLTVTLTVRNLGPSQGAAVKLRASLLGRTTLTEVDHPACSVAVGQVECTLEGLIQGGQHVVQIHLQPSKTPNFDILATVDAPGQLDPDLSNNEAFFRIKVLKPSE